MEEPEAPMRTGHRLRLRRCCKTTPRWSRTPSLRCQTCVLVGGAAFPRAPVCAECLLQRGASTSGGKAANLFRVEGLLEHYVEAFGGGFKVDTFQQSKKFFPSMILYFLAKTQCDESFSTHFGTFL